MTKRFQRSVGCLVVLGFTGAAAQAATCPIPMDQGVWLAANTNKVPLHCEGGGFDPKVTDNCKVALKELQTKTKMRPANENPNHGYGLCYAQCSVSVLPAKVPAQGCCSWGTKQGDPPSLRYLNVYFPTLAGADHSAAPDFNPCQRWP